MKFIKVKKVESRGANVNRIYKHLQEHCVCFITAFRQIYDIAENNKRNEKLYHDLRALGYGIIKVIGGFPEKQPDGSTKKATEKSFVVVANEVDKAINEKSKVEFSNQFKDDMMGLCKKYEQENILIRYYEGDNKYITGFLYPSGNIEEMSNNITFKDLEDYWTRIHNKVFRIKTLDEDKKIESSFDFSEEDRCCFDFSTGNEWIVQNIKRKELKNRY